MAEMTIEKAKLILEKARISRSGNLTDLELVKKLEITYRDSGLKLAFASLIFLRFANHKNWELVMTVGFLIGILAFAIFLLVRSERYSKIRGLFESQAPQYLDQLNLNANVTSKARNTPEDW